MEILILKNDEIFARSSDNEYSQEDEFRLELVENIPEFPGEAPKGKYWELIYNGGDLEWILKDRPLTQEERIAELEAGLSELLGGR